MHTTLLSYVQMLLPPQVYVLSGERGNVPKVQTDGINLEGVWSHADLVDINSIQTNDITAMLRTYGVEVRACVFAYLCVCL